ncbi:MAG TPA: sulfotransferase [Geminicoccaceae bacterium]|nr:sulfotransferase [Geminicoccaceae bacterium]
MRLPTFIIIGAGRSGTTSLHHYLNQHPEVFMSPIKETCFFAWEAERDAIAALPARAVERLYPVRSLAAYAALFAAAGDALAVGEATPRYLFAPGVPEAIRARLPDARLILVLREPTERAFAAWLGHHRAGTERRNFAQVVEEELGRADEPVLPGEKGFLRAGLYHRHLARFRRVFPPEQLHVRLYEDLERRPEDLLREVLRFIGVDPDVRIDMSVRHNPTGLPQSRVVERLTGKNALTLMLKRSLPAFVRDVAYRLAMDLRRRNLARPTMPPELRERLRLFYRTDVEALEQDLGRDLSAWRG